MNFIAKFFLMLVVTFFCVPHVVDAMELYAAIPTFQLDWGVSTLQAAGKSSNDDRGVMVPLAPYFNPDKQVATDTFFAVYDGHGGYEVADYLEKKLHKMIVEHLTPEKNIELAQEALLGCFSMVDDLVEQERMIGGSTAVAALLLDSTLYVANTGDSRAVIYKDNGQTTEIWSTKDHKPNDNGPCSKEGERERIERDGGFVKICGLPEALFGRLGGRLAVSRSIGDYPKPKGLIAVPDVISFTLDSSYKFMIVASDGLWDVMAREIAVQFADKAFEKGQTAARVAEILAKKALSFRSYGAQDDITVIVVRFNWS